MALTQNINGQYNVAVGDSVLTGITGSVNNVAVGHGSLNAHIGNDNTCVGTNTMNNNGLTGSNNSAFGSHALFNNQVDNNSAFGYYSLTNNTTGTLNSAFGYHSLLSNISGSNNSAFGYGSLSSNIAVDNTAMGTLALNQNTSGGYNTAIGSNSQPLTNTGNYNTSLGAQSLYFNNGDYNTSIGALSLYGNTGGTDNTSIGYRSDYFITTGSNNVTVGTNAGCQNANYYNYSNNTCIGYGAVTSGGDYNTYLGYDANTVGAIVTNYSTGIGYNATPTLSNQIMMGTTGQYVHCPGNSQTISGVTACSLKADGNIAANQFYTLSDYRIKENVKTLDETYITDELNPVTYININTKGQDIGFLAHELQEHFPCLVNGEKDGDYLQNINYNGLIPILVKEIQELKKRVIQLETKFKN